MSEEKVTKWVEGATGVRWSVGHENFTYDDQGGAGMLIVGGAEDAGTVELKYSIPNPLKEGEKGKLTGLVLKYWTGSFSASVVRRQVILNNEVVQIEVDRLRGRDYRNPREELYKHPLEQEKAIKAGDTVEVLLTLEFGSFVDPKHRTLPDPMKVRIYEVGCEFVVPATAKK